jgi:phosphoglycerol transferase
MRCEIVPPDNSGEIKLSQSDLGWSVFTGLLAAFVLTVHMKLWELDFSIPLDYTVDNLLTLSGIRNIQLGNWYLTSNRLGFPHGQQLYDFPAIADGLPLAIVWLLTKCGASPAETSNLFFLSGYVISAVTGHLGARLLNLRQTSSIATGFLFTFLPYHFQHGSGHLFLSWYPIIPIWLALIIRLMSEVSASGLVFESRSGGIVKLPIRPFVILLGVIVGASGLYYAVFMLISSAFAVAYTSFNRKKTEGRRLLSLLGLSTVLCMLLQAIPVIAYQLQNGTNPLTAARTSAEVEYYSLRIIDLLLPVASHRLSALSNFAQENSSAWIPGEPYESLGFLGSLGVLIIISTGILRNRTKGPSDSILIPISSIFLFLTLMATVGGGNQVLAAFGLTEVRVWSRVAIVLGFLALVSLFFSIDQMFRKSARLKSPSYFIFFSIIIVIGFADTNPPFDTSNYDKTRRLWNNDADVIAEVEKKIGSSAALFQLPIIEFPEGPIVEKLSDYQMLRGYLHSKTLCWSYGSTKGREGLWLEELKSLNLKQLTEFVKANGFDAIWIERRGYVDNGERTIKELSSFLGEPIVSDKLNTVVAFSLGEANGKDSC